MIGLLGHSGYWLDKKRQDKIDAYLALAGLYLVLAMPLLLVWKRWAMEVDCALIGLLLLVRSAYKRDWRWLLEPPILIASLLWLYSLVLVTPFALNVDLSFGRTDWFRFILFFAAIVYWLSDYRKEIRRIAYFVAVMIIAICIDAIIQHLTGSSLTGNQITNLRLTGPFDKTVIGIYLAKMSLPIFGILLYHAWNRQNKPLLIFWLAVLMLILCVVVLSNERTAAITFILGLGVAGTGLFFLLAKARRMILLFAALSIGALALIATTQERFYARTLDTQETLGNFAGSSYVQTWKAAIYTWKEFPYLGAGLKNFREFCPVLLERNVVDQCDMHAHNTYLELLSEAGIFGFIGLIALIASMVIMVVKQRAPSNKNGFIITIFALATLMINFFPIAANQSFFANWPAMLAWYSLAIAIGAARFEGRYGHG